MFDNIRFFVFDQGLMNQPDEVTSVRTLSEQVIYHDGDVLTIIIYKYTCFGLPIKLPFQRTVVLSFCVGSSYLKTK